MFKYIRIPALVAITLFAFLGKLSAETVNVSKDNQQMSRAITTARSHLPKVMPLLDRLGPKSEQLGMKILVRPANSAANDQYVWVDQIKRLSNDRFQGRLTHEVAAFKSYRKGKRIKFRESAIGDWYLVIDNRVYGEFTTRVIRELVPKHERSNFNYLSTTPLPPGW